MASIVVPVAWAMLKNVSPGLTVQKMPVGHSRICKGRKVRDTDRGRFCLAIGLFPKGCTPDHLTGAWFSLNVGVVPISLAVILCRLALMCAPWGAGRAKMANTLVLGGIFANSV